VALLVIAVSAARASAAQAYTVSGTVTDQATGQGVGQTAIAVTREGGEAVASTTTAVNGRTR
jgi:hypothetical protein